MSILALDRRIFHPSCLFFFFLLQCFIGKQRGGWASLAGINAGAELVCLRREVSQHIADTPKHYTLCQGGSERQRQWPREGVRDRDGGRGRGEDRRLAEDGGVRCSVETDQDVRF